MTIQQIIISLLPSIFSIITVYVTMEKKLAVQEIMIKQLSKEIEELKNELKDLKR